MRTRCLALLAATLFILSAGACGTSARTATPDTQAMGALAEFEALLGSIPSIPALNGAARHFCHVHQ